MGEPRRLIAERLIEEDVAGRAREPLVSSHDVADLHEVVIDDDGQVVRRVAVRFQQHEVVQRLVLEDDVSAQDVVRHRLAGKRRLEPHNRCDATRLPLGALLGRQVTAVAIVARRLLAGLLRLPHLGQALRRTVALVRFVLCQQPVSVRLVQLEPLRLHVRPEGTADIRPFVPVQAEPAQGREERLDAAFDITLLVGVLDAQDELTAVVPRQQPVVERRADVADVRLAGGRGGVAGADGAIGHAAIVATGRVKS